MHASTDRLRGRMWVCERGTTQDAGIGFRARYCVDRFRANDSQGIYVKIATVVLIEFVSVAESGGERCGWSGTQREKGSDLPRRNSESNGVNTLRFQCDRDVQRLIPPYLN